MYESFNYEMFLKKKKKINLHQNQGGVHTFSGEAVASGRH